MNLHEYQAKELLLKFKLPILKGKSYTKNFHGIEADLDKIKSDIDEAKDFIKQNM